MEQPEGYSNSLVNDMLRNPVPRLTVPPWVPSVTVATRRPSAFAPVSPIEGSMRENASGSVRPATNNCSEEGNGVCSLVSIDSSLVVDNFSRGAQEHVDDINHSLKMPDIDGRSLHTSSRLAGGDNVIQCDEWTKKAIYRYQIATS